MARQEEWEELKWSGILVEAQNKARFPACVRVVVAVSWLGLRLKLS